MKIKFEKMSGGIYAINPQVISSGNTNRLRIAFRGCTHVFIVYTPLGKMTDWFSQDIRQKLSELPDSLFQMGSQPVSIEGTSMTVRMISNMELTGNGNMIILSERAGNYAICGCGYDRRNNPAEATLYLPNDENVRYQATASTEIRYSIKPYFVTEKAGFLRRAKQVKTEFYVLTVGDGQSSFQTGEIRYQFAGDTFYYPITAELKGKDILIKGKNGQPPSLSPAVDGIILREV